MIEVVALREPPGWYGVTVSGMRWIDAIGGHKDTNDWDWTWPTKEEAEAQADHVRSIGEAEAVRQIRDHADYADRRGDVLIRALYR